MVGAGQIACRDRGHRHDEVDPIPHGTRQPSCVALHQRPGTPTGPTRVAKVPARARIHRGDQHEPRGKGAGARGTRNRDGAVLHRLAQDLQRPSRELRQLVQEQHSVMREADLTRPGLRSAAGQGGVRHRVMRRAKRPHRHEPRARRQQTHHRVDRRHLQRLVSRQHRQQSRESSREHRLARAGRAYEEQVVAAGRSELERTAAHRLAVHVRQIGDVVPGSRRGPLERLAGRDAADRR